MKELEQAKDLCLESSDRFNAGRSEDGYASGQGGRDTGLHAQR
jgi:hypothetical protein